MAYLEPFMLDELFDSSCNKQMSIFVEVANITCK